MQALHHVLFTPSLLPVPVYIPSLVGWYVTAGILFLLVLSLRWIFPLLRSLIPPASRAVLLATLFSLGELALVNLFWGSPAERWDLDTLWAAGSLLLFFAWIHLTVHLLSRSLFKRHL